MGVKWIAITLFMAFTAIVPTSFGQSANGRLIGTVSGPDGVLANASIVVTDNQTKQSHAATTNGQGAFIFPQLDVGSYSVSVSAPGFKTFTANDVRIDVGKEYALNPTLEVGEIHES